MLCITGWWVVLVAPFTGAWIEMAQSSNTSHSSAVAPFTGAWIEIPSYPVMPKATKVAPFTGAWIEIWPPVAVARCN